MQQTVGKDVAALGIGAQLDFIDGEEIDIDIARHGLDGRYPIARPLRFDLFFARDERDFVGSNARFDLVVDFAREQPQRQTDHAAFVTQHAFDGEMRLARIGRAQHRSNVANTGLKLAPHGG